MNDLERSLSLVVCAAPLAERAADLAGTLIEAGWRVRVVVTPTASEWVEAARIEAVTGSPLVTSQRRLREARTWGDDDGTLVAPLTFNTLNKWAMGISDNYALGVLNESISLQRKTIAVPMIGPRFWDHPARARSMDLLWRAGVVFLDPLSQGEDVAPVGSGVGPTVAAGFDAKRLVRALSDS